MITYFQTEKPDDLKKTQEFNGIKQKEQPVEAKVNIIEKDDDCSCPEGKGN